MTFEEYDKKVHPGMRVFVVAPSGEKLHGIAGNLWSAEGQERVVKFDNGAMAKITEKNCHLVQAEMMN